MSTLTAAGGTSNTPPARLAPDSALLEQIAAGESQALSTLFARHGADLYDVALEILSDPTEAAETVNAVSREVVYVARRFNPAHYPVNHWLAYVTRLMALDRLQAPPGPGVHRDSDPTVELP